MSREQEIRRQFGVMLVAGICLLGIVGFAPDAGIHAGAFFKIAMASAWGQPLEWAAAWCSLKIILLGLGLFLVVDALGTSLLWLNRKKLAVVVFFTQIISVLVLLIGGYYLLKSLL